MAVLIGIGILAITCKPFLQYLLTGLAIILLAGVMGLSGVVLTKVPLRDIFLGPGFGMTNPVAAILSIVVLAPWAFVGFEVISLETAHFQFPVKKSKMLIGVTAVAAVLSSVIGFYRATNRILANMADDNILNRNFAKPRFCFLFIMAISVAISLLGRNALAWIVDLSSLGAVVAFGYASAAVWKTAKRDEDKKYALLGKLGLVIFAVFAFTQLMPHVSVIEPMETESFFLLGLWCLLGFAFYWRTMRLSNLNEQRSETVTISALFVLLFYSALVWYIKSLVGSAQAGLGVSVIIQHSVIFGVLVLLGLLVMLLIASQLKKHQDMLESDRIRAIEGSKAKSQFLFNMSHDIRTPMNAIIGYTNLAKQDEIPETTREYLGKIETSSQHLLALINDILEMSRIESGKIELEYEPINICHVFDEMYDLFQQQMNQKRIDFSVHTAQVHHPYVWCDKRNLNRVLLNLLSNAYKFTPEGGTISASIWESIHSEDDSGAYELRVKDNGIGMSKEFSDRMFNAFERERSSTASKTEGTGLGLAITKGIIDLMGGIIEVITSPDNGTEIIIRIKLQFAGQGDVPDEESESPNEKKVIDFTGRRALLVEDNEANREIAIMILAQAGFDMETAEDGQIAVSKVASSDPGYYDIILMDIQMPVMDDYEATKEIRALDNKALADIPIVAMTANAFKEDEQAAAAVGMQGHIAKPLDNEKMLKTLSGVLSERGS